MERKRIWKHFVRMGLVPSIVKHFSRSLNVPVELIILPEERQLSTKQIGLLGEKIARRYLQSLGFQILAKNFRPSGSKSAGEIDLVAREGQCLVFIEVKTRTSRAYGRPIEGVSATQKKRIQNGARNWLNSLKNKDIRWRIDVVEVLLLHGEKPHVHLIRNAF